MKNNIIKLLLIGIGATIINSCSDNGIEVIEFDDSYSLTPPKKGNRDTPPPVDLLNTYAYFAKTTHEVSIARKEKSGEVNVSGIEDVPLTIHLNKKAETNLDYEIKIEEEWAKKKGKTLLPKEAYEISGTPSIAEGVKTANSSSVHFNKEYLKTLAEGEYVLPLRVEFKTEGVKYVKNQNETVLQISVRNSSLPEGNNVSTTTGNLTTTGVNVTGDDLILDSNYATDHLYKLNDLSYNANWWTKSGSDTWLTIGLKEVKKINAVTLITYSYSSLLKSVKVSASDDKGNSYVEQGTANFTEAYTINIVFNEPIEVDKIKLEDFVGYGSWINVHEIRLQAAND